MTTGRSFRLVLRVSDRNGFEGWTQLVKESAPKTACRRFAMLQAVLQPGMGGNPATLEETWRSMGTSSGRLREPRGVKDGRPRDKTVWCCAKHHSKRTRTRTKVGLRRNSEVTRKSQTRWRSTTEAKARARAQKQKTDTQDKKKLCVRKERSFCTRLLIVNPP